LESIIRTDGEKELGDVVSVEGGTLGGEPARQVSETNVDYVLIGINFTRPGGFNVTARFSSQIDDNASRLHFFNMFLAARYTI
jgi:hypothetical protein